MIRYIEGRYLRYDDGAMIVVTSGGVGFRINVPATSNLLTHMEGETVNVYTHMSVKQDGISLYGFAGSDELSLFEKLLSVSNIGPKAALAIMDLGTANQIKSSIASKDVAAISSAKGIGKKTAERVILELGDKVSAYADTPGAGASGALGAVGLSFGMSEARAEALVALTTLGYSNKEAEKAVSSVTDEDLDAAEYVKKALRFLM